MVIFKDCSALLSFAFGNERTLVTCKSCELRSASQRVTRDQCSSFPNANDKSVLQSLYLCLSDEKKNPSKSMTIFPTRDQCLSLEIFATVFLCFITCECHRSVNIKG